MKSRALFFRPYSYCLQNLGITCIAYSFSPLHETPDIFSGLPVTYIHIDDGDRFYKALFSALEQTHCALVACHSTRVTGAVYSAFRLSTQVVDLRRCFGCYMAGATSNCSCLGVFRVHYTTVHQFTSLHAKATCKYSYPHTFSTG